MICVIWLYSRRWYSIWCKGHLDLFRTQNSRVLDLTWTCQSRLVSKPVTWDLMLNKRITSNLQNNDCHTPRNTRAHYVISHIPKLLNRWHYTTVLPQTRCTNYKMSPCKTSLWLCQYGPKRRGAACLTRFDLACLQLVPIIDTRYVWAWH